MSEAARISLFGIVACDQVRQARKWLKEKALDFDFHDLRKEPPDRILLLDWLKHIPHDSLLNRRGQTWRQLPLETRQSVVDQATAVELLLVQPMLIKRPVLSWGQQLAVGFNADLYENLFSAHLLARSTTSNPT